jgi:hypothetical protein
MQLSSGSVESVIAAVRKQLMTALRASTDAKSCRSTAQHKYERATKLYCIHCESSQHTVCTALAAQHMPKTLCACSVTLCDSSACMVLLLTVVPLQARVKKLFKNGKLNVLSLPLIIKASGPLCASFAAL